MNENVPPPPRSEQSFATLKRTSLFLLSLGVLLILIVAVGSSQVWTQAPPENFYPGDPVSEDDKIFVSLDASENSTCGVTRADNIRCWGSNRYAPLWAGGFTDVAVGNSHSCGLNLDGTVQCWGVNVHGAEVLTPPTDDGTPIEFKSIDSMRFHTCGIRADNDGLVCWGADGEGQASGTRESNLHVAYDYQNDSFTKISAGDHHTCGLVVLEEDDDQTNVRCWGSDAGARGVSTVPAIYSSNVFKDIDVGRGFTCGIIDGGENDSKAVCWGINAYPVLGTPIGTGVPDRYIGQPSDDEFTKISAGVSHVCGIKADSTIACWGTTKESGLPEAYGQADVPMEHQSSTFSDVVADTYHTCAILDAQNGQVEGDVVCWGADIPYDPLNPNLVSGGRLFDPDHPYPPPHQFPQIGAGIYYNCGLSDSRDLVCWGGSNLSPGIVPGPFKALDLQENHVCAIRDSGHIICWGFDNHLQASGWSATFPPDPPTSFWLTTQAVENLTTDYTFKSVSVSYYHSCGILDGETDGQTDGEALCWGRKIYDQTTPPAGATFASLSAGWHHTCGLLDDQNEQTPGTALCWGGGNNTDFGQIDIPDDLQGIALSSISASRYHTCAIREDNGQLTCWGHAGIAQIPEEIAEQRFLDVDTSWFSTCAINEESLVKCWGYEESTSAAIRDIVAQFRIPTDYAETRFRDISAALRHACATKDDGKVLCWGADADVSTPELEIYHPHATVPGAFTIINTRQAWVPREFRVPPPPPPTATPAPVTPTATATPVGPTPVPPPIRILRIEPDISDISMTLSEEVELSLQIYDLDDIRNDALGDFPEITFEWTTEDQNGDFTESIDPEDIREENDSPDDRRVLYTAPTEPGRYRVSVVLDVGTECVPPRDGETEQDAVERCTATFQIVVQAPTPTPTLTPTPTPIVQSRILRIEPDIRSVHFRPGEQARLDLEVYGRQDIRDDTLGDASEITFEWVAEDVQSQPGTANGSFDESMRLGNGRDHNHIADDRRVIYTSPTEPGRYRVRASLDVGKECQPARMGETEQDAIDRCTAIFEIIVTRHAIPESTPEPPVDPSGEIPDIIIGSDSRNYEVFTPEDGGQFVLEDCTFKAPRGTVRNNEVIGVSITVLEEPDEKLPVADLRFITDGVQCRIDAVDIQGARLIGYPLRQAGEVCMPLPKRFTPKAVDTLVGRINEDGTLTRLSSKLYLASPDGRLKVCGNLSTLSATTVVALSGEVADELPPTPAPPEVARIDTGAYAPSPWLVLTLMLVASMTIAISAMILARRRPRV